MVNVKVEVEIPSALDIKMIIDDEIYTNKNSDGNYIINLTNTIYSENSDNVFTTSFVLRVGNVNQTEIDPKIIVSANDDGNLEIDSICNFSGTEGKKCASTNENEKIKRCEIKVNYEQSNLQLQPFLISGYPYGFSQEDGSKGRFIPVGIVLGVEVDENFSLKGKYINPMQLFNVTSTQNRGKITFDSDKIGLISNDNSNYFPAGSIPYSKYISTSLSVINSGDIEKDFEENNKSVTFNINNLEASVDNPIIKIGDKNVMAFGTYYVTLKSIREENDESTITTTTSVNLYDPNLYDPNSDSQTVLSSASIDIENVNEQVGTKILKTSLDGLDVEKNLDNTQFNSKAVLSYGETVDMNVEFEYGADADSNSATFITIPITDPEKNSDGLKAFELVSEVEVIEGNANSIKYKDCSGNELDIANINISNVCSVEYEDNLSPGSNINIKLTLKSNNINQKTEGYLLKVSANGSVTKDSTVRIDTVDFKARTNMFLETFMDKDSETGTRYDITNKSIRIDGSEIKKSTLTIYPYLHAPGLLINTGALGNNNLDTKIVRIELPEGVTYIPNSKYVYQPDFSSVSSWQNTVNEWCNENIDPDCNLEAEDRFLNNKILYYYLKINSIGDYIEPIKLDVSFEDGLITDDIKINSKIFITYNSDNRHTPFTDSKSTTVGTIKYSIPSAVISSLTAPSVIDKDESFDVIASIINKTNNKFSDVNMIINLPELGIDKDNLNVIYDFGEDAECSTTPNDWTADCNEDQKQIKSVRYNIQSLESNSNVRKTINVNIKGNTFGDKYMFNLQSVSGEENIVSEKSVIVEVNTPSISGFIWEDFNKDGRMQDTNGSSEKKVDGVRLHLFKVNFKPNKKDVESVEYVGEQVSKNGFYKFTEGVSEGNSYYIVPQFDMDKYGLTTYHGSEVDVSKLSSFKLYENDELSNIIDDNGLI